MRSQAAVLMDDEQCATWLAPCSSPAGPVNRTDFPGLVVAVRPGAEGGVDAAGGDVAPGGPVCSPPPSPQALSSAVALLMLRPRSPNRRSASLRLSKPSAKSSATSPTR